ncbi:(+)-neomenthol dehydrogenase-like protein [Tanacetum coccineum]
MEEKRSLCAVVSGGNKGIGFEICRQLALNGLDVILTARNESRGIEAVNKLNVSGLSNVVFHQLDIKKSTSMQIWLTSLRPITKNSMSWSIMQQKMQVIDENVELLNGVIEEPYELAVECLKTNYYGAKKTTEALVPLLGLSKSPRIVNVTSAYGDLHWFHNEKLKEELHDIENLTEERIDEILQWFLRDFKAAKLRENGWPLTVAAYKVSKAALNAYTRLMARKYQNILVNCATPGYCITDMTSQTGFNTAEEGAKCPVMAATLPDDGPSGVYFDRMEIAPFILTPRGIH